MKRKGVLLWFIASLVSVVVYSYRNGAAAQVGVDATGASGGGGCTCHNSATTDGTAVELDSSGVRVTSYHPGTLYTVKISASNGSNSSLPRFGFQLTVVKSAGSGVNPVDAGTWGTSLPTNVQNTSPSSSGLTETIIEQSNVLSPATGTGGNGITYVESIPWTAPAAGTGSVVIYGVVNEVNNDGSSGGDKYQMATPKTITEATAVPVIASVSISQTSGTNPTCSGNSLTFTATPTNGGNAPTYQWKINGVNSGTGATFTSSTLTNGAVITCVMTSNLSGVTGSPATSNSITVTINPSVTPSVSITSTATTVCSGQSVIFTATPTNGGTSPTYQWKNGGVNISGATSSTYTSSNLANNSVITVQLTSNALCATTTTATSNAITVTVGTSVTPSVSIAANTGNSICSGQSVTFSATPTNGGTAPVYQWYKNGSIINGATGSTFSSSTLINGDAITVQLTSNASCATTTNATSNTITMSVSGSVTPSVTIISNSGSSICSGQSVTFTATPTNGGSTPSYQWLKNGSNISGATSSTYNTTTIANGDVISVQLTSNATCASITTALSNTIAMSTVTNATPSVTINSATGNTICTGQSITFTATPTNGGTSPTYQWRKNSGNISGANSSSYTSSSLANGDVISVSMTSNSQCVSTTGATSNTETVSVVSSFTPTVNIFSNSGNSICAGQNVTFTATPTNGGTPTWQWLNNGNPITGQTGSVFTSSTLTNGDVISVRMTSSLSCASPSNVTSNAITMSVSATGNASVTVLSSNGTSLCTGQSTSTFTAVPVNGGATPAYQWVLNGNNVPGATGVSYTPVSLSNGDVMSVKMISSSSCITQQSVVSPILNITVGSGGAPVISISADNGLSVCEGSSASFTAVSVNGGSSPVYQWQKNGSNVGGNSTNYIDQSLTNGDVISCSMTSSLSCASPTSAVSNSLVMSVYPLPSVTITENNGILATSPGISYQWYENNIAITGATSQTLAPPSDGSYSVKVTDQHGCENMASGYNVMDAAVQNIPDALEVVVYPNPTDGFTNIGISNNNGSATNISVYDANGRLLLENSFDSSGQKIVIDLSSLQDGIYLLQVNQREEKVYRRIVISR